MTFKKICDELGIGKYAERIFNSNSHGELFHLHDYVVILEWANRDSKFKDSFPSWFEGVVKWADDTWERPDSVFQHIVKLLEEESNNNKRRLSKENGPHNAS